MCAHGYNVAQAKSLVPTLAFTLALTVGHVRVCAVHSPRRRMATTGYSGPIKGKRVGGILGGIVPLVETVQARPIPELGHNHSPAPNPYSLDLLPCPAS